MVNYFLTFRLAPSSPYCANSATAVNVSAPYFSKVFFYKESIEKETWQTHAYSFRGYYYVTLKIQSVVAIGNIACWPIIDDLLLTGINFEEMRENNDVVFNEFLNNGFEVGPGSPLYFTQGILLEAESNLGTFSSGKLALDPWIVLGTVKYIDSNHYVVPQGHKAVELISASEFYVPQDLRVDLRIFVGL
ncbi:lysine--tRNA ligase, class II [Tanacetum coccineum]